MKRTDPYIHTRGDWKHNEMVWAVLAVLYVTKQRGYPPLRAKTIHEMTGCNYSSLIHGLPKWVEFGWIIRRKPIHCQKNVKDVYTYHITNKGKTRMYRMENPQQRGVFNLTFSPGVDRRVILRRLPFFNQSW